MHKKAASIGLALTVMVSSVSLFAGSPPRASAEESAAKKTSSRQTGSSGASIKIHLTNKKPQASAVPGKPATYTDDILEKKAAAKSEPKDPLTRAKMVLREIESIEHPENYISSGSPGWMEERNAAINSSQQRLHSCQARLTACGPTITPLLAENLSSPNRDVSQTCSNVLGQFGEASVPSIIDVIKKSGPQPMATAALKTIGVDALPPLVEMLKSSDAGQSFAAITVLNSFLPDQYIGNAFRSSFYRRARYQSFGAATNQEIVLPLSTINALCHLATKDKSIKYREQLVLLLGKVGPRAPIVAETLIGYLSNEEQPVVREAAVHALGSVTSTQTEEAAKKSYDVLISTLKNDDFEGCRAEAATILGNLPGAGDVAIPALTAAFKEGYSDVSSAALQALGNYGDKSVSAVPTIIKYIEDKPDTNEAANALRTLARIRAAAPQIVPLIVKLLDGQNAQLQLTAVNAVETLGPTAAPAVKPLIPLLASTDANMRYSAIRALGAIGPQAKDAVQPLRDMVKGRNSERNMVRQSIIKITGNEEKDPESNPSNQPAQSAPVTNINAPAGSSI